MFPLWISRSVTMFFPPRRQSIYLNFCTSDASEFLRAHPLPGRSISDTFDDSTHRTGGASKRVLSALQILCGRTGEEELDDDVDDDDERTFGEHPSFDGESERFHWTRALQHEFREELEK
jgi:hypothetical protein